MTAAALAAVIFFVLATLPPGTERLASALDADLTRRTIAGAYHVHTTRSDGTADKAAVAASAARAGLRFVIFTDHGDGTRPPDPPAYIDGVLCIDAVEISTDEGHYVAIGMPAAPYPLGGAAAAVIEDVTRLGGFGIAAHPDSPKASLRWRDPAARVDGVEWLSADSEWRDEPRRTLVRALADYLVMPAAALASLLDRPTATLAGWDAMAQRREVVALAAHDAHGGIGGVIEDGERAWVARVPSYEATFRSMSTRAIVDRPLTGEASEDARAILHAVRTGRVFSVIDAVATPAALDFRVRTRGRELAMGETDTFAEAALVTARATVPSGAQIVLVHDGNEIAAAQGGALEHPVSRGGVYRIEVRAPKAPGDPPTPWLLSNPVYLRPTAVQEASIAPRATSTRDLAGVAWRAEHDPASQATVSAGAGTVRLDYRLRPGERASQFAALVADLPGDAAGFNAILFTADASAPLRVSVQLRFGNDEERWGRSVYLDGTARPQQILVADMRPAGKSAANIPDTSRVTALLFVVDLTNAAPGAAGWFGVQHPSLGVVAN